MNRFLIVLVCIVFLVICCFFKNTKPYIKKSNIIGKGLFAGKNYKKGDIIYTNLFPYKENNKMLYNPITAGKFNQYILKEGKYINHCVQKKNVSLETNDYKVFYLVADKNILKHQEILADYNKIHNRFPFIRGANPNYIKC